MIHTPFTSKDVRSTWNPRTKVYPYQTKRIVPGFESRIFCRLATNPAGGSLRQPNGSPFDGLNHSVPGFVTKRFWTFWHIGNRHGPSFRVSAQPFTPTAPDVTVLEGAAERPRGCTERPYTARTARVWGLARSWTARSWTARSWTSGASKTKTPGVPGFDGGQRTDGFSTA